MSTKVAIAIPTHNRLGYLKECIRSILDQTFQDFAVYVFDNASQEPVEQELQALGDPRIHFIGSETNIGVVKNFDRIRQYPFESEYLVIFHDDDAMHPRMLELETSFLDAHPNAVFVVSDLQRVSDKNIHVFAPLKTESLSARVFLDGNDFLRAVMSWLRYAFDSAMYRTHAVRNHDVHYARFSDFSDVASLVTISQKGSCGFLPAPLVNYRIHPQQDSRMMKKEYKRGAMEFLSFLRESLSLSLSKGDERLMRRYAVNFLLRTYADINQGVVEFLRFLQTCRQKNLVGYYSLRYLDARGFVSLASIFFRNRKIIDAARWVRNLFQS